MSDSSRLFEKARSGARLSKANQSRYSFCWGVPVEIEVRVVAEFPVSECPTLQYRYQTFARPDRHEHHQLNLLWFRQVC
jgi:hypothetical protein